MNSGRNGADNSLNDGTMDWRKAAEEYARSSQQKGMNQGWPSQSRSMASNIVGRYGGASNNSIFGGPPRMQPKSPATRNAAQVIHEGIQKACLLLWCNLIVPRFE